MLHVHFTGTHISDNDVSDNVSILLQAVKFLSGFAFIFCLSLVFMCFAIVMLKHEMLGQRFNKL